MRTEIFLGSNPFWRCCVLAYRKRFPTWGLRESKERAIRQFVSKLVILGKHSGTAECFLFFCTAQTRKAFSLGAVMSQCIKFNIAAEALKLRRPVDT